MGEGPESSGSYYEDLGVDSNASTAEITKAFRKLALTYHPDRGGDPEVFQRINEAHEVLSDPKSRARYDTTGRTGAVSLEEELRESFFDLGGWGGSAEKTRQYAGGGRGGGSSTVSAEQREEAQRKEAERQERLRKLEESERRDAARRAGQPYDKAAAQAQAPTAPPPPVASPAPATAAAGGELYVGARVRIMGLSTRPELNGVCGTLVQPQDGKWQVRCDGDLGDKLMKVKNLFPVDPPSGGAAARPTPAAAPQAPQAPQAPAAAPAAQNFQPPARSAATAALKAKAMPQGPAGPPPKSEKARQVLPRQQFQVVHQWANVRQLPSLAAKLVSRHQKGEFIWAQEETFDGWVRLDDEKGWVIKDMKGQSGIGKIIEAVGPAAGPLAVPQALNEGGPRSFEVVFKPRVAVRSEPSKTAPLAAAAAFGEAVVAETQAYGGWVRLADGSGWVLSSDPKHGQLLVCRGAAVSAAAGAAAAERQAKAEEDQQRRVAEQESSMTALRGAIRNPATTKDTLSSIVQRAKRCGLQCEELRMCEDKLAEMRGREAQCAALRDRIDKAGDDEDELGACAEAAMAAGMAEEAAFANRRLTDVRAKKSKAREEQSDLLEQLAQAAASGDPKQIKAARDAAKKAGVKSQEIARIFALNTGGGPGAAAAPPAPAPAPEPEAPPAAPEVPPVPEAQPAPEEAAPPQEEPPAAAPGADGAFDGYWVQEETGEYQGTISGSLLQWPDGPAIEIKRVGDNAFEVALGEELFHATLGADGRLTFSDGDVWARAGPAYDGDRGAWARVAAAML